MDISKNKSELMGIIQKWITRKNNPIFSNGVITPFSMEFIIAPIVECNFS